MCPSTLPRSSVRFQHSAQLLFCPIVYGVPAFSTLSLIISPTRTYIHLSVAAKSLPVFSRIQLIVTWRREPNRTYVGSALSAIVLIVFVDAR